MNTDEVLCIVCAEDHLIQIEDKMNGRAPLKNAILETVRNELQIDHHYIP